MNARTRYLEALGIDLWVPREPRPTGGAPDLARASPPPQSVPAPAAPAVAADAEALWESLRSTVSRCTRCALCQSRTQTVFGVGDRHSDLFIIGEAPGAEEDARGEPFVGRAGQLLNSMLLALGRPRATVYIANVLKCRPPGNRDPQPDEVAQCLPYLQQQVAWVAPRLIIAVGRIAAQNLLATDAPLARLRARLHRFGAHDTPLIVTYHPAYLLRSPAEKRKAWEDLKLARAQLQAAAPRA